MAQTEKIAVPLKDMNERNARFSKWKTVIFTTPGDQKEYKRSYTYSGKERTTCSYDVLIVDADDHTVYCKGTAKKTAKNSVAYAAVMKAITDGAYKMSHVAFVNDANTKWLGCSKKVVVDLLLTKFEKLDIDVSAVQPAPPTKINGCQTLGAQQCFDLTALISSVSPPRNAGPGSQVFDVQLRDGSISDNGKPKNLPLTVYTPLLDANNNQGREHAKFRRFLDTKQPVTITQISGQQKEGKYEFKTTNQWWIFGSTSIKGRSLSASADSLLEADDLDSFELIRTLTEKDWSTVEAIESNCYLLRKFLSKHTSLNSMDTEETLWQVNWATVAAPPSTHTITTQDGQRIWFETVFRDLTGTLTIYITEKAALKLADMTDAEEFRSTHTQGQLWFAQYVSVKIVRRPSQDPEHPFSFMVVDASIQSFDQPPTTQSVRLLPLLDAASTVNEAVLPVNLDMVHKNDHYPMIIKFHTQPLPKGFEEMADPMSRVQFTRPAVNIVALVVATTKSPSKTSETIDGGYMLTTTVSDYALSDTSNAAQPAQYKIRSYCTLDNVKDFKIDPPRGQKQQVALVQITAIAASNEATDAAEEFTVDSVQLVQEDQAIALQNAFQKLIYYGTLVSQQPTKEKRIEQWTDSDSPMSAKKCRRLGKAPTGDELPCYRLMSSGA